MLLTKCSLCYSVTFAHKCGWRWKQCSSSPYPFSATMRIGSQTLPTHFLSFLPSESRPSSLWNAAVVSPTDLLAETLGLHLFYPILCASLFTDNVNNCHHRHSFLFLNSTYPCNSNPYEHTVYPLSCSTI